MMDFKDIKKDCLSFEASRNIIYNHDIYKKDLSLGMTLSWPVLRNDNGKINIAFFLYPNMPSASAPKDTVSRPSNWIIMNSLSGIINIFADCRLYDFADTQFSPFTKRVENIKDISIKEFRESQKKLTYSFDILRTFAFKDKDELNEIQLKAIEDYKQAFLNITPPGHIPFYKDLAKDFFEWLGL